MTDPAIDRAPLGTPAPSASSVADTTSAADPFPAGVPSTAGVRTRLRRGATGGPRPPSRRVDAAWTIAFWITALVVLVWILWIARHASWWADDWKLIFDRLDWTPRAIFAPHWEHPIVAQALLWKLVYTTVGLNSYLPFLAFVGIAHVMVAGATFHIVRRLAGGPVAFGTGLVMLLLGSGGQSIVVPAALNLTGALAAGLWALAIFLDRPARRGLIAVTLLLLLGVAFSGAGLYFVAIIGGLALLQPERRREMLTVVPALGAYLAWRVVFDDSGGGTFTRTTVQQLVDFVLSGASNAIGAITGLGTDAGLGLLIVLGAATGWHLLGRRPMREAAVAGFMGLVVVFGVTALARAAIVEADGTQASDTSRYVYLAAPFLLIACAGWVNAHGPRLTSLRAAVPVGIAIVVAILINQPQLNRWARFVTDQGNNARALIAILEEHGGSPALPLDGPPPSLPDLFMTELPTFGRLLDVVHQYGSPLDPDPLAPDRPALRPETLERVLVGVVGRSFIVTPDLAPPMASGPAPTVSDAVDASVLASGSCLSIDPTGGAPVVTLQVPGGDSLAVTGPEGALVTVSLSADGTFSTPDPRQAGLHGVRAVLVTLPDLDSTQPWSVRLAVPDTGPSQVCAVAPTA